MVATAAAKAWSADLGRGEGEGPDGFVVGTAPLIMVRFRERMFMINCFDRPYVDDPQARAEQLADLRLRGLFARHAAWVSCDALSVDATWSDEEVRACYRLCGRLIARLVDDNTLAIL